MARNTSINFPASIFHNIDAPNRNKFATGGTIFPSMYPHLSRAKESYPHGGTENPDRLSQNILREDVLILPYG